MKSQNRLKNICLNFILLFIVCISLFCILEVFLRIYPSPFVVKKKGQEIVIPRKARRWEIVQNPRHDKLDKLIIVSQNSIGFRGDAPPNNFSKYLTLIAVGGSATYSSAISDGKTWVDILGLKLKNSFKDVWINNAGFNGHSTTEHISLMKTYITKFAFKPKIVMFLVGKNDSINLDKIGIDREGIFEAARAKEKEQEKAEKVAKEEAEKRRKIEEANVKFRIIRFIKNTMRRIAYHSEVYTILKNISAYINAYNKGLVYGHRTLENVGTLEISEEDKKIIQKKLQSNEVKEYLMAYEKRLQELIKLSRDNNIEPIFITQPVLYGNAIDDVTKINLGKLKIVDQLGMDKLILNGEIYWQWEEMVDDVTRKVAANENILLIDLARKLPKSSKYYIDLIHYSNKGSEVVADIIYEELCSYLANNYNEYLTYGCEAGSHAIGY